MDEIRSSEVDIMDDIRLGVVDGEGPAVVEYCSRMVDKVGLSGIGPDGVGKHDARNIWYV